MVLKHGRKVVGKMIESALGDQALEGEDGLDDRVVPSESHLGGQVLEENHAFVWGGKQM